MIHIQIICITLSITYVRLLVLDILVVKQKETFMLKIWKLFRPKGYVKFRSISHFANQYNEKEKKDFEKKKGII